MVNLDRTLSTFEQSILFLIIKGPPIPGLGFFSISNLIHKRGQESSIVIDQARKKAKIEAGDDIRHPFNEIKGKKIFLTKTLL